MDAGEVPIIFQYGAPARKRARLLLVATLIVAMLLVSILLARWGRWNVSTQFAGLILVLAALFGVRAQFTRLIFRLILDANAVAVALPLGSRRFLWPAIAEVQRINLPQIGRGGARWICAIWTIGRSGHPRRYYLFDSDIEGAAAALELIDRHTPHARHTGRATRESAV